MLSLRIHDKINTVDALREYREEKSLDKLIQLFKKEQEFFLEKCKYFLP